jgi:hypothetical protein
MSYNLNVNDDFNDKKSKRHGGSLAAPPLSNDYNSHLNFADMPQPTQAGFFDAHSYGGPNGSGYNIPNVNQTYYQDWSNQPQFFNPQQSNMDPFVPTNNGKSLADHVDYDNEPPLLEELGINFEHIFRKTKCVLNPFAKPHETIIHDEDLAGPLVFCIAYGFSLLLLGKIQFGYIYGITALGYLNFSKLTNLQFPYWKTPHHSTPGRIELFFFWANFPGYYVQQCFFFLRNFESILTQFRPGYRPQKMFFGIFFRLFFCLYRGLFAKISS